MPSGRTAEGPWPIRLGVLPKTVLGYYPNREWGSTPIANGVLPQCKSGHYPQTSICRLAKRQGSALNATRPRKKFHEFTHFSPSRGSETVQAEKITPMVGKGPTLTLRLSFAILKPIPHSPFLCGVFIWRRFPPNLLCLRISSAGILCRRCRTGTAGDRS